MRCLTAAECQVWRDGRSRRGTWKRQVTCVTPLKRLQWFTGVLLEQLLPFDAALLVVDEVVFDIPPELVSIRRIAGEQRPVYEVPGHLFKGDPDGLRVALRAALSGWIDLRVIFSPARHALLSDHDEFTMFFSESPGKIADVRRAFETGGLRIVEYTAPMP